MKVQCIVLLLAFLRLIIPYAALAQANPDVKLYNEIFNLR